MDDNRETSLRVRHPLDTSTLHRHCAPGSDRDVVQCDSDAGSVTNLYVVVSHLLEKMQIELFKIK